jgi:hypothetical protein
MKISALKGLLRPALKATLMLAAASVAFTSCSDDDDDDVYVTIDLQNNPSLSYNTTNGAWDGVFTSGNIVVNSFTFSHKGFTEYGGYFNGFVPSISEGQHSTDLYANQYDVMSGAGYNGAGSPFFIAYWSCTETEATALANRSLAITYSLNGQTTFSPVSVQINNACYTYYTILVGDSISKKFEDGDYLKVIAHGVKANGSETTSEFYLANCHNGVSDWFVTDWTEWNLSSLGEVTAVYFTMESSDTDAYGMNTPSYFAIDQFKAKI